MCPTRILVQSDEVVWIYGMRCCCSWSDACPEGIFAIFTVAIPLSLQVEHLAGTSLSSHIAWLPEFSLIAVQDTGLRDTANLSVSLMLRLTSSHHINVLQSKTQTVVLSARSLVLYSLYGLNRSKQTKPLENCFSNTERQNLNVNASSVSHLCRQGKSVMRTHKSPKSL